MRAPSATALLLSILVVAGAAPSAAAKKTMKEKIVNAAVSGAVSKPAEVAVQLVSAAIYDAACPASALDEVGTFLCNALGGVSGRTDDAWKEEVDRKLKEISGQLTKLEDDVQQVKNAIERNHKESEAQFEQAAAKFVLTQITVRVDNLYNRFKRQLDAASTTDRAALLGFANEVIGEKLHTKLGDLNVVLTEAQLDGQPMLRYPFYVWTLTNSRNAPREAFDPGKVYDFAEQKFGYYRAEQQKLYLVYLWAAEILESNCEVNPASCNRPPVSSKQFKKIYDDYTRDQIIAFNQATEWLLLSYGYPHSGDARFLPGFEAFGTTEEALLRANLLTSSILGKRNGLWGRVIAMGNKWDGSLEVQCGAQKMVLSPALRYTLPVAAPDKSLDWWVSDNADRVYNQVRFAPQWTMYHYDMADAPAGRCTVSSVLPNRAGMLPWVESDIEVVPVGAGKEAYNFGSFIAIQRAGGAYALAGGEWKRRNDPFRVEDGTAARADLRFNWKIDPARSQGPLAGLWSSGQGLYVIGKGSRAHNYHQIYLYNDKKITFPEDSAVTLNLRQTTECLDLCAGPSDAVLEYNIENSDGPKQHGLLDANVALFFDEKTGSLSSLLEAQNIRSMLDLDNGIHINASYGSTGERKTHRTAGDQRAVVRAKPGTGYHLQYLIEFQLFTEGRGLDATAWDYKAKITPSALYLTR